MQRLTLFMIVAVTTFSYFANGDSWHRFKILPGFADYIPELLGAFGLAYVLIVGTRSRFQFIRPAYWIALFGLILVISCGVIVNDVEPGPIFAGLRTYLRALPWFLIPAIYAYSDKEIRQQLQLLLMISLVQIPLAIEQRIKTAESKFGFVAVTGDRTAGTLGTSGILSIFLVGVICVLVALYSKKILNLKHFLVLFFLILFPTTINETKVMIVILPLGLLISFWFSSDPAIRVKRVVVGFFMLLLFGSIFVPVYDKMNEGRKYGSSLGNFLSNEDAVKGYLASNKEIGSTGMAGRADAIAIPLRELAKDPVSLAFGYGIGNASDSALGKEYTGKHSVTWSNFLVIAFTRFVLEMGLFGVGLILAAYAFIFFDCCAVARMSHETIGAIAAGWTGVVALIAFCTFYIQVEVSATLSYLFWYFSGLIAAERVRLATGYRMSDHQPATVSPS